MKILEYLTMARVYSDEDWWHKLPVTEQSLYLKEHPKSHLKKDNKKLEGGYRKGPDNKWYDDKGNEAHPEHSERIKSLRIPPAWTDVKLSVDPDAPLQAVGKDVKGRSQYVYSAEHTKNATIEKFNRLKDFSEVAGKYIKKAKRDAATNDSAAAMLLIAATGFRVGSDADTGAEKKAYGASNLMAEHCTVSDNKKHVTFSFTGKKGVTITKKVSDPAVVKHLLPRIEKGGRLFDTSDDKIRDYMKSIHAGFKVKDFRTWNGTNKALQEIEDREPPKSEKEFKKMQLEVCKKVAEHLGNTPSVAKESYICPSAWAKWEASSSGMEKEK